MMSIVSDIMTPSIEQMRMLHPIAESSLGGFSPGVSKQFPASPLVRTVLLLSTGVAESRLAASKPATQPFSA
jgi:hypothetical protein